MTAYLVLLRGINVGGKNKVSMAELRSLLEGLGFENVSEVGRPLALRELMRKRSKGLVERGP